MARKIRDNKKEINDINNNNINSKTKENEKLEQKNNKPIPNKLSLNKLHSIENQKPIPYCFNQNNKPKTSQEYAYQNNNIHIRNTNTKPFTNISKYNNSTNVNYLKDQLIPYNSNKKRGKSSQRAVNINVKNNDCVSLYSENNENYSNINLNNVIYSLQNNFANCDFFKNATLKNLELHLEKLWEELGINVNYIKYFNVHKKNISGEIMEFLMCEIANLTKIQEILYRLHKQIELREKSIITIKKLITDINNEINEKGSNNDIDKKLLNAFFNTIISYRIYSIKLIEYFLAYKEKCLNENSLKFNEEALEKKIGYSEKGGIRGYLLKMRTDMNFVNDCKLITNNKENEKNYDPFLINLQNIIPFSKEIKQKIGFCNFFIEQEIIFMNIKNNQENYSEDNTSVMSHNNKSDYNRVNSGFKRKKLEPISNNHKTNNNHNSNNSNTIVNNKGVHNKKQNISCIDKKKGKNENIKNNLNINKETQENILQNSLTISKQFLNNQKEKGTRSVTPESKKCPETENNIINIGDPKKLFKKNIGDYNISYYCGTLSNFINIYKDYYTQIPIEQIRIFNILKEPIEYFDNNYFPKIIITTDKKLSKIKGICIYSHLLSNNDSKINKIFIHHLSSYNTEDQETIFKNIFEFLKNNNLLINFGKDWVNEIYIDLYYFLDNQEKFIIDQKITNIFKILKFKWVKLENISKTTRYQKMKHQFNNNNNLTNDCDDNNILNQSRMGMKALYEDDSLNDSNISDFEGSNDLFINNFLVKYKTVLKYENAKEIKEISNNTLNDNCKFLNPFSYIYLNKKITEDTIFAEYLVNNTYNFYIKDDHLNIEDILNDNEGTSLNDLLPNNTFLNSNITQLTDFFNNNTNNKEKQKKFEIKIKMNFRPLFDNCISIPYKNYYYNRIKNANIKHLIEKETNQTFYFLTPNNNKSDNIIFLLSSNINKEFKSKFISNNRSNISLKFIDIYNNLKNAENENSEFLYIPSFEIKKKLSNEFKKQNDINTEENQNEGEEYAIKEIDEYFDVKVLNEDLIEVGDNKINKGYDINFYYDKIEEDTANQKECFIDDEFVIFVLNFNIIDNFAVIPLLSLYVTKEDFITKKDK